jgi:hypothetical protein
MPKQAPNNWKPLPLVVMTAERIEALRCVLSYAELGYSRHGKEPKPKAFEIMREIIGESELSKSA